MQRAENLLSEMSQAEKILLLQLLAKDLGNTVLGIVNTPGVCGGVARINGTRIPVWTLVQYRNLGVSEADILGAYPTLRAEDLTNAWTYYHGHKDEIEQQIFENENASP